MFQIHWSSSPYCHCHFYCRSRFVSEDRNTSRGWRVYSQGYLLFLRLVLLLPQKTPSHITNQVRSTFEATKAKVLWGFIDSTRSPTKSPESVAGGAVIYGPSKDAFHCRTVCQPIHQVSHLRPFLGKLLWRCCRHCSHLLQWPSATSSPLLLSHMVSIVLTYQSSLSMVWGVIPLSLSTPASCCRTSLYVYCSWALMWSQAPCRGMYENTSLFRLISYLTYSTTTVYVALTLKLLFSCHRRFLIKFMGPGR